jgi:hypothetical protein
VIRDLPHQPKAKGNFKNEFMWLKHSAFALGHRFATPVSIQSSRLKLEISISASIEIIGAFFH